MSSVVSQNLFALLDDDEEIDKVEKTNEAATTPQNQTVLVQKQLDRSRASKKEARIKHDYPQRGGFKNSAPRGNDDNRSGPRDLNVGPRLLPGRHEENDNNYNYNSNSNYPSRNSRGARPGERGRGGRRGDGGGRGGGREYDRHSASGRYDSEKKENQGWGFNNTDWEDKNKTNNNVKIDNNVNKNEFSANWESVNNETAANDSSAWDNNVESQEPTNDWATKAENGGGGGGGGGEGEGSWDAGKVEDQSWEFKEEGPLVASEANDTKDDNIGDDEAATKPVEPEEIIKTLEEYLSEKAQKTLEISLPEVRKPNEGVDDSQWKDAVPLEKKEEEDILFSGKEQSFKTKNKSKKLKNYLEIKPTFDKPGGFQRGGGGRGRGGGRGGGGGERNYDNRRGGGGGGERSYDNRDNRRGGGGGGGERNYRGGDGGGERNHDDYNNRRRGGDGGGNRGKYVNIDDQRAFPSLGTPV